VKREAVIAGLASEGPALILGSAEAGPGFRFEFSFFFNLRVFIKE